MPLFKRFLENNSGAITADWVVLTSALVGISIAVMVNLSGGLGTASLSITNGLTSASGEQFARLIDTGQTTASDYTDSAMTEAKGEHRRAYRLAHTRIGKDAPDGYRFTGKVDDATGQPIYRSTAWPRSFSIGGNVVSPRDYRRTNTSTSLRTLIFDS